MTAAIGSVRETQIGDTVTEQGRSARQPLPDFNPVKSVVFCGLYPMEPAQYDRLKEAIESLWPNDPAFAYEPENSSGMGFGFRCGFLWFVHMEIVQERLEREYELSLSSTVPSVTSPMER